MADHLFIIYNLWMIFQFLCVQSICVHDVQIKVYSLSCANDSNAFGRYNASMTVFWNYPCDNMPPVDHFHIKIFGFYSEAGQNSSFTNERNIPATSDDSERYGITITDIKPSYIFNTTVQTVSKDGSATVLFSRQAISPTDCPNAPQIKTNAIKTTSTTCFVSWEGTTTGGQAFRYDVNAEPVKPNHYVPSNGCSEVPSVSCDSKMDLQCTIKELQPDYYYNISVRGINTAGYGQYSFVQILTQASEPGIPRNLSVTQSLESISCGNYNSSLVLSWTYPCDSNGDLDYFGVRIQGKKDGYEVSYVKQSEIPAGTQEILEHTMNNLNESYIYTAEVWAVSNNNNIHSGNTSLVELDTPACSGEHSIIHQSTSIVLMAVILFVISFD